MGRWDVPAASEWRWLGLGHVSNATGGVERSGRVLVHGRVWVVGTCPGVVVVAERFKRDRTTG